MSESDTTLIGSVVGDTTKVRGGDIDKSFLLDWFHPAMNLVGSRLTKTMTTKGCVLSGSGSFSFAISSFGNS